MGVSMKSHNDVMPRTRTTGEIDRGTMMKYNENNSSFAGILYPEEDSMPPLLEINPSHVYANKKVYL